MEQLVRAHISVSQVHHSNTGPIFGVPNFHNNIKDIMSDTIKIMKTFKMFQGLPKCDKNIHQHLLSKLWNQQAYLRQGYHKLQFVFCLVWFFKSVHAKHTKQRKII